MTLILVLGAGININGTLPQSAINRLSTALKIYKHSDIILCSGGGRGGLDNPSPIYESQAMKQYAITKGVPASQTLIETKSLDTIGNAYFSKPIIDSLNTNQFTIITTDFHIPRTKYIFSHIFSKQYSINYKQSVSKPNPQRDQNEKKKLQFLKRRLPLIKRTHTWKFFMNHVHPFYTKNHTKRLSKLQKLNQKYPVDILKKVIRK